MDVSLGGPVVVPSPGPTAPMASMAGVGLKPGPVWSFHQQPAGGSTRISAGFPVEPGTVFELAVFPDLEHDSTDGSSPDPNFGGCHLGIEFVTDDGPVTLVDQHRHPFDGSRQCLVADNWNLLQLDLAPLVGRQVRELRLASLAGVDGAGWFQLFGPRSAPVEVDDVVDRVRTTRGSHSAYLYSRGNTLPQASLPPGLHFLTPLTEARSRNWLYGWHRDGGPVPKLQGFAFNHAPSPWIADRSAFQVMPLQRTRSADPEKRACAFSHDDEVDRPHRYAVSMQGGITADMVPTHSAAVFRFTFERPGLHGVVLDQPFLGSLHCKTLPDGRMSFWAAIAPDVGWNAGRLRPKPPAYVYGETSVPARANRAWEWRSPLDRVRIKGKRVANSVLGKLTMPLPRPQAIVLECDGDVVEVRAAMSFISIDQARHALAEEVGQQSFDELVADAHDQWAELLQRLEIDGGTLDQRTTAWSNLARLYSWPSAHHENLGTADAPHWAYASPHRPAGLHTPKHTGCEVVDGRLYVNNGYWDTFRTGWPLYSLLTPRRSGDLLDGILQQYRDDGWMSRWAAPGHVDCMPGTSSDVIFANASLAGTFASADEELAAYDSALRNATVPSDDPVVGRKGIGRGRFVGWIDTDTEEGLAWSVDSAMEDAAITLWSGRLAERARASEEPFVSRRDEFEANQAWFANRALSHQQVFDPAVGFYQGRRRDGSFRFGADEFDPAVWGRDFTETSGWGQAFHAPHDGAGLAALLGGEEALAAKLDELLVAPAVTRPSMWGGYDYNTQEMNEAQADGIGQLAISNQPAHHIPFMYLFAGQPHKTQWLTRELLDKKFVGSEIGQGYPGDEDNGEMSGYWLCLAMGLFPLFSGSGEWALTAPLFERMAFTRDDGTRLEVRATGVEHRYVQSVRVNGVVWDAVVIPTSVLCGDDVLVEFELGPQPSGWGVGSRPWSASVAGPRNLWQADRTPLAHLVGDDRLVDDRGDVDVVLAAGDVVELTWDDAFEPSFLTLTTHDAVAVPVRVEVRRGDWCDAGIVAREPQWGDQTIAHLLGGGPIDGLRLVATEACVLSQVEVY